MKIRLTFVGLGLMLALILGHEATAQRVGGGSGGLNSGGLSGGGFGSGGITGSRGMASSGRSGTSALGGMSGMGGMGGMGQGLGQGMGMGTGMGAGMGMGMGGGQMGFGSTGNQGFVGRDAADVQTMFQSMGMGTGQGTATRTNRGQTNRGGQGANRRQGQTSGAESTRPPIRVRVQVAFDYPTPVFAGGTAGFEPAEYDRILENRRVQNFAVTRVGTRVVISGVAADVSERLLMEKLVSLEPGVLEVDNQMTLAEEIAAPTLPDSTE